MNTLDYLIKKHEIDTNDEPPFLIARMRWKYLPRLFRDLGFKVGAEIGVQAGLFSKQLCQENRGLKLYSIDAWISYGWYRKTTYDQTKMEAMHQEALHNLEPYDCEVIRGWSHEVVEQFKDESLDFVFIDANADFRWMYQDIELWSAKVRPGGIVSGHDYFNSRVPMRCRGKDAVDLWTWHRQIAVWFVLVGSRYPSWYYVK